MNLKLKKEIIYHIFGMSGLIEDHSITNRFIVKFNNKEFLTDKTISFEGEDKKYPIYSLQAEVEKCKIKILIADISENEKEFILVCRMDDAPVHILQLSAEEEDFGNFYIFASDNWIEMSSSMQAKFLLGFENLVEIFPKWIKNNDCKDLYDGLLKYLDYIGDNND